MATKEDIMFCFNIISTRKEGLTDEELDRYVKNIQEICAIIEKIVKTYEDDIDKVDTIKINEIISEITKSYKSNSEEVKEWIESLEEEEVRLKDVKEKIELIKTEFKKSLFSAI